MHAIIAKASKYCTKLEYELFRPVLKPVFVSSKCCISSEQLPVRARERQIRLPEQIRPSHNEPSRHDLNDVGLFYTIPPEDFSRLCPNPGVGNGFSVRYLEDMKAFNECAVMIRRPALEVINYLKHSDFSRPVQRYLLYGDSGTGKSMTLQHITHYCMREGWLILPTMYAWAWNMYRSRFRLTQRDEVLESQWKSERYDQPLMATQWLGMFRELNSQLLKNITTTKEYTWTKREKTEPGKALENLVDLGISRPRIATDVIGSIMREIRCIPAEDRPQTLVTIDCFEALFSETWLKKKVGSSERLQPNELAFFYNLKKLISNTWTNGAVVVASSGKFTTEKDKSSAMLEGHLIYDIIGPEGFDVLDPHIPVEVPNYTHDEVLAQIAYYKDRKWLLDTALTNEGKQEIVHMACNNPLNLELVCGGFV